MVPSPVKRLVGVAILTLALGALLVGDVLWTPPLTRSTPPIQTLDSVLVDVFSNDRSPVYSPSSLTRMYVVSACALLWVGVRTIRHWRLDRRTWALSPTTSRSESSNGRPIEDPQQTSTSDERSTGATRDA